ncbi:MAG TPA: PIN domain-containing protein [Rhizomicrobium sp.]
MIATDTSSLIAFLQGDEGNDVDKIQNVAAGGELIFPPVVLTEILSDPRSAALLEKTMPEIALLDIIDGYWARAGKARRILQQHKLKAKIADALIAQSCIDHDVALITRDTDFRHFAKHCGLKLA